MREFASGQVKKGVRAIGFGGDGATWGNYALVWKDTDTALVDSGWTGYDNGNTFSFSPWKGALIDVGGTLLDRANAIAGTEKVPPEPNLGFEQAFWSRRLVLRTGLDESTYGAGASVKFAPLSLDVAYLDNLGQARIGTLFGQRSNSVIVTLTVDYASFLKG